MNIRFLIYSLATLVLSGSLLSCNFKARKVAKSGMKDFLYQETGRQFEIEEFYHTMQHRNYYGKLSAIDDSRVVVHVVAVYENSDVTMLKPDIIRLQYQNSNRSAKVSDQALAVVTQYFEPALVHAKLNTDSQIFNINIYVVDELTLENLAAYKQKLKLILKEITPKVPSLQENSYLLQISLFENEFNRNQIQYSLGSSGDPDPDYILQYGDKTTAHQFSSFYGHSENIENKFKKAFIVKYNDIYITSPTAFLYQNSDVVKLDKNDIRETTSYLLGYFDEDNEIIRKYCYFNMFTGEIGEYSR